MEVDPIHQEHYGVLKQGAHDLRTVPEAVDRSRLERIRSALPGSYEETARICLEQRPDGNKNPPIHVLHEEFRELLEIALQHIPNPRWLDERFLYRFADERSKRTWAA